MAGAKDMRSFTLNATAAEMNKVEDYMPFVFECVDANGDPYKCKAGPCGMTFSFGCGNTLEDTLIISLLLMSIWTWIIGFTVLLIHAMMESDEGTHVALWCYFWFFLIFITVVVGSIQTSAITMAQNEASKLETQQRIEAMKFTISEMEKKGGFTADAFETKV